MSTQKRRKRVDLQLFALVIIGQNVIYYRSYTSDTLSQHTQNDIACTIIQEFTKKQEEDISYYHIRIDSLDGTVYCNTKNNITIAFLLYPSAWLCKYSITRKPLIPDITTSIHNDLDSILQHQISTMNNNKIPLYIVRIQCHNIFNKRKSLQNALSKRKRQYQCRRCRLRIKYCCKNFYKCSKPILKCIGFTLLIISCCWIPFALYLCRRACLSDDRYIESHMIDHELALDRTVERDGYKHDMKHYELTVRPSVELGTVRPTDPFSTDGKIEIRKKSRPPKVTVPITTVTTTTTGTVSMQDTLKSFGAAQWGGGAPSTLRSDYIYEDDYVEDVDIEVDIKDEYKIDKVVVERAIHAELVTLTVDRLRAVDVSKQMKLFLGDIKSKFRAWRSARKLVDNVFTDLENLFYLLAELVYKCEFRTFEDDMKMIVVILINFVLIFVNMMVYVLVVLISLIVVLPSCFFLLIVRMDKVETDTVKLYERAERLRNEVKCQRFCRLMNQFMRASFMFGFLCIYPIIIMYIIIPNIGNNDVVVIGFIGSYLFIIIALQIFGTYRAIKSFEERKKLKATTEQYSPQIWKWNMGSVIGIILLFYEVFQLAIYAFHVIGDEQSQEDEGSKLTADSLGIDSKNITDFSNPLIGICYLSIDFVDEYILEYYALFSIISIGLLLVFFIMRFIYELKVYGKFKWTENNDKKAKEFYFHSFLGTIIYGHGTLKDVSKWSSKFISLLSDSLFLVIAQKVILIMSCTSPLDDGKSYLRIDRDTVCWEGKHQLYATIALILLGYYIPICAMIAPIFAEDESDDEEEEDEEEKQEQPSKCKEFLSFSNTMHVIAPFMSALTVTECFMLISSEFVSRGGVYGTICSQAFCMICLMVFTMNWSLNNLRLYGLTQNEPVFPFGISMIRTLGFVCGFCGCIIEIFRFHQFIDSALDILILMFVIVVSSLLIFVIFWKYHSIFNQFDDDIETESNLMAIYDPNDKIFRMGKYRENESNDRKDEIQSRTNVIR